jgi:predicted glycoside hydrolase/deacetylase ChbG (UPF0249 family)
MVPSERVLIVNADDLGRAPGINEGIFDAVENGIVTSASLMVRWPSAREAAAYARAHPDLSVGLHLDLGEHVQIDGEWVAAYTVVELDDDRAVSDEIARQLAAFDELIGRPPTHLDSHQHVHRNPLVRPAAVRAASEISVPLRHFSDAIRYRGDFYGRGSAGDPLPQAISADGLIGVLESLRPGATELCCHPGSGEDPDSMYGPERRQERDVLCDPRIRDAIEAREIELRSFLDLHRHRAVAES